MFLIQIVIWFIFDNLPKFPLFLPLLLLTLRHLHLSPDMYILIDIWYFPLEKDPSPIQPRPFYLSLPHKLQLFLHEFVGRCVSFILLGCLPWATVIGGHYEFGVVEFFYR